MRTGSKLLQEATALFCHGSCQVMLPRGRFYDSNLRVCMTCWTAIVTARRDEKRKARMRNYYTSRAEQSGRTPKRRLEALLRIEAGMTRCILPRPRDPREAALAGVLQCAGLCLANERNEHLREIHGLVDLSSDEIAACFVPVERVADRLNADDLR